MPAICNLNGAILAEAQARVSVLDRGFLFGDSVYEVLRTRRGVPFAWREHLERLRSSAECIGLRLDLDDRAILRRVKETLAAAELPEAYIRIVTTRGEGSAPSIDLACAKGPCTWVILVRDLPPAPSGPGRLALIARLRNDRRALDPGMKSGNYLNNLLGLAEAKVQGATDCLFLNHEGRVTEASTSNVWLVKDRALRTPPPSAGLLRGITRRLLMEHAAEAGLVVLEVDLGPQDLRTADEIFLSSTLRDLLPIVALDGEPVSGGRPGPLTSALARSFEEYCTRRAIERDEPGFAAV